MTPWRSLVNLSLGSTWRRAVMFYQRWAKTTAGHFGQFRLFSAQGMPLIIEDSWMNKGKRVLHSVAGLLSHSMTVNVHRRMCLRLLLSKSIEKIMLWISPPASSYHWILGVWSSLKGHVHSPKDSARWELVSAWARSAVCWTLVNKLCRTPVYFTGQPDYPSTLHPVPPEPQGMEEGSDWA